MAGLFYSPHLTFIRAQHYISDFKLIVNEFVNGNPYAHIVDQDPHTGEHIHKIKFTQKLPDTLPCVLFDIANNLRASLDQVGYAAAVASGKSNPKRTNFPFGDDAAGVDNNIDGRKVCIDCPPEIIALFRGQKPYKGGNDPLWALNRLCNTKKHSALVPVQISQSSILYTGDVIGMGWAPAGSGWDADKEEITFLVTKPGVQPKITADVTIDVAIGDIETVANRPARHVLANMSRIVQSILVATERESRRLFKL
jgi:hypothetical protein